MAQLPKKNKSHKANESYLDMGAPSFEQIKAGAADALERFYRRDIYLVYAGVHERSLTFRLGMYLQQIFPDWDVDCEYNKNRAALGNNKFLSSRCKNSPQWRCADCRGKRDCTVFPDIIIHRRGTSENLLVIEAKIKATCGQKREDQDKIEEYLIEPALRYRYGLFIDFRESFSATVNESLWCRRENGEEFPRWYDNNGTSVNRVESP